MSLRCNHTSAFILHPSAFILVPSYLLSCLIRRAKTCAVSFSKPGANTARRPLWKDWRKPRSKWRWLHPEYHALLDSEDRNVDRDFLPEGGQLNPFLHLSLHLALAEQISIDQPRGIRGLHAQLLTHAQSGHDALHLLLECLGGKRYGGHSAITRRPDEEAYLDCIRRKLG